jgi:hypothetical protein
MTLFPYTTLFRSKLFQETATGGMESSNVVDLGRKLFDQVAGVK